MDDTELKNKLVCLGMQSIDADILIKIARNKKTSVRRVFFRSVAGLYYMTTMLIFLYLFFTLDMNEKENIAFSTIFLSLTALIFITTSFLKKLLWSIRILFALRGK